MIVELARRVSSCGWVALCERRRAGFARLSGWHPVGNWVASGANFPASLLPVGVIPTRSRESRRTVGVGKGPRSKAESDPAYRRKAETIPRGGGSFFATAADAPGGSQLQEHGKFACPGIRELVLAGVRPRQNVFTQPR